MQTRKRAKSVMFGKKLTEPANKEKKVTPKHHEVLKEEEHATVKTAEKASVVERRTVHEKPQIDDTLSAELPKIDDETDTIEEKVSKKEDVADSPPSEVPEAPKDIKEALTEAQPKPAALPDATVSGVVQPVETPAEPTVNPDQSAQTGSTQELSSTLPPSAFTIQSDDQTPVVTNPVSNGKRKFVIYFLVVAFISFVLGLAAMAGASYFGLANFHLTNLANDVHVSSILGKKPTPTAIPPTSVPTQVPLTLSAYTITVLNGSGIAGKAASEKADLTTAGFSVSSVGNAPNSNFTQTEISAKSSVSQVFLTKLESELQKNYQVDSTIASNPDSSQSDVTVTIGSQAAK